MGWVVIGCLFAFAVLVTLTAAAFDCRRPDCSTCGRVPLNSDPALGPANRKATP